MRVGKKKQGSRKILLLMAALPAAVLLCVLLFTGKSTSEPDVPVVEALPVMEALPSDAVTEQETFDAADISQTEPSSPVLDFVDVFGEHYQTQILTDVPRMPYDRDLFIHDGYRLSYEDDHYSSRMGVDVSHHQGTIDWEKVRADGFDFAFIRLGYRGYGQAGSLRLDKTCAENIRKAQGAGLEVGVYFFAQAINEEEAREEAEFVLRNLQDFKIDLPVVYDPESILDAEARTDGVSGEQFTKNTLVFCSLIEEAGYQPMIYSNMLWEAFQLDMTQVSKYPFWYADYEAQPQTPYDFVFWQYSNEGHVNGISGSADLNIELIRK